MGKHTPGPWKWHGVELLSPRHFVLSCSHSGRPVAFDASLIAAAPELLEALQACVIDMQTTEEHYGEHPCAQEVLEKARAAIAKATQP